MRVGQGIDMEQLQVSCEDAGHQSEGFPRQRVSVHTHRHVAHVEAARYADRSNEGPRDHK